MAAIIPFDTRRLVVTVAPFRERKHTGVRLFFQTVRFKGFPNAEYFRAFIFRELYGVYEARRANMKLSFHAVQYVINAIIVSQLHFYTPPVLGHV